MNGEASSQNPGSRGRVGTGFTNATIEHKPLTPQQYADAVSEHARQTTEASLFPGNNFQKLALWLQQGLDRNPLPASSSFYSGRSRSRSPGDNFPFLAVHELDGSNGLGAPAEYYDPEKLAPAVIDKPTVIFLRGKPSSHWLAHLGAKYKIDPEFFNRHLDFISSLGLPEHFVLPPLSSSQSLIFDLPYITLGRIVPTPRPGAQSSVDSIRSRAEARFERYVRILRRMFDNNTGHGQSMVRKFSTHDQVHFAIEQRVTVHLHKSLNTWQLFIWTDTGKTLSQSPTEGPWLDPLSEPSAHNAHHATLIPTIRVQPAAALKSHMPRTKTGKAQSQTDELSQTMSSIHQNYGSQLDAATMASDPFYVLYDILHLVAVSYKQYLNMLEHKDTQRTRQGLKAEQSQSGSTHQDPESWNSTNLRYDQAALQAHLPQLRGILEIIRHRGNMGPPASVRHAWPHPPPKSREESIAHESARSLLQDFEDLLTHADRLLKRYQDGMGLLMNRAVMAESAKSVEQARVVTKLTRLAFFYIPLNFVTSFFGMNLFELANWGGAARLPPLWLYFAVSLPVLLVSIAFMRWDMVQLFQDAVWWTRNRRHRHRQKDEDEIYQQSDTITLTERS